MGRPKEHDDNTRAALRAAAERLVESGGPAALTVRGVAREAGTTTRAVYSVFGSRDGLLVDAVLGDSSDNVCYPVDVERAFADAPVGFPASPTAASS